MNFRSEDHGPVEDINAICYNIELLLADEFDEDEFEDIIHPLFKQWPEFSGEIYYPVPGGMDAYDYVQHSYWVGNYGAARIRLLNFLISKLSE